MLSFIKHFYIFIILGIILTGLSGFVGKSCTMIPPGGFMETSRGFPIPYYYCNVLGESSLTSNTYCATSEFGLDNAQYGSECLTEDALLATFVIADITFWSIVVYTLWYFSLKIKKTILKLHK